MEKGEACISLEGAWKKVESLIEALKAMGHRKIFQ